jgi:hypothetical protein
MVGTEVRVGAEILTSERQSLTKIDRFHCFRNRLPNIKTADLKYFKIDYGTGTSATYKKEEYNQNESRKCEYTGT